MLYDPDPQETDRWTRASIPNGFRTYKGVVVELTPHQKKVKELNRIKNKKASKARRKQR